jgi:hypothetical protein
MKATRVSPGTFLSHELKRANGIGVVWTGKKISSLPAPFQKSAGFFYVFRYPAMPRSPLLALVLHEQYHKHGIIRCEILPLETDLHGISASCKPRPVMCINKPNMYSILPVIQLWLDLLHLISPSRVSHLQGM